MGITNLSRLGLFSFLEHRCKFFSNRSFNLFQLHDFRDMLLTEDEKLSERLNESYKVTILLFSILFFSSFIFIFIFFLDSIENPLLLSQKECFPNVQRFLV